MRGLESQWVKLDPTSFNFPRLLVVSPLERRKARELVEKRIAEGAIPPFKLSRKELSKEFPEDAPFFVHSMLVMSNADGSYRIGAMSRSKTYTDPYSDSGEEAEKVREGILGHGAFGVAKVVQWEDGSVDAVKIEGTGQMAEHAVERQIMQDLGYLREAFVQPRDSEGPWIGTKKIKDKLYTIQQRHAGIEMKDYFRDMDIAHADSRHKYEIGLRAALSIQQLHDRDIIHCDIKPANFMINVKGSICTVASIDFGFSKILPKGKKVIESDAIGTPLYVAPEVVEYQRDADGHLVVSKNSQGDPALVHVSSKCQYSKAADVFSLGIMFREDLHLGKPGSPLHEMIGRMTSHNPDDRPSIHEVAAILQNPDNYKEFIGLYHHVESYTTKKTQQAKQSWFAENRQQAASLLTIAKKLEESVNQYRYTLPATAGGDTIRLIDQTADQILSVMREHQSSYKGVSTAAKSSFNIETLQNLPTELRDRVCEKLGIPGDSAILLENNNSTRKELAAKIDAYRPVESLAPTIRIS